MDCFCDGIVVSHIAVLHYWNIIVLFYRKAVGSQYRNIAISQYRKIAWRLIVMCILCDFVICDMRYGGSAVLRFSNVSTC